MPSVKHVHDHAAFIFGISDECWVCMMTAIGCFELCNEMLNVHAASSSSSSMRLKGAGENFQGAQCWRPASFAMDGPGSSETRKSDMDSLWTLLHIVHHSSHLADHHAS